MVPLTANDVAFKRNVSDMNRVDTAVSEIKGGLCCSQAILCAYGPSFGLDHEAASRVAAGFGGGMGRMAETCGAVTGAYMVLGLAADPSTVRDGRARIYETVREFAKRFTARNGSVCCRDLMGCDISTAEGLASATEKGLFASVCVRMVRDAAEILEEMLPLSTDGDAAPA